MTTQDNACIFDFETLSRDTTNGVVVSMTMLNFSEARFTTQPYTFPELVRATKTIKFNVQEQVKKYNRKIEKETLDWWGEQIPPVKKQINPTPSDVSITKLYDFFILNKPFSIEKIYTRGNTFDPIFVESIIRQTEHMMPYDWWEVRDTRSLIEGLSWGTDLKNTFIPPKCEGFVKHDPTHDISIDVMRMQTLVQAIT